MVHHRGLIISMLLPLRPLPGRLALCACGCQAGAIPLARALQVQQLQGGAAVQGAVSMGRQNGS
jgi:hypothetical protein